MALHTSMETTKKMNSGIMQSKAILYVWSFIGWIVLEHYISAHFVKTPFFFYGGYKWKEKKKLIISRNSGRVDSCLHYQVRYITDLLYPTTTHPNIKIKP